MEDSILREELKHFLTPDGKLNKYPSKARPKLLALFYLASKFEGNRKYTEREVNEVLAAWHTFGDWAMLRRDLYDRRFLGRELHGGTYWLEENQPSFGSVF